MTVEVFINTTSSLDNNTINTFLTEVAKLEQVIGCQDDKGMIIRLNASNNDRNQLTLILERVTIVNHMHMMKLRNL